MTNETTYRAKAKVKTEIQRIGFLNAEGLAIKPLPIFAESPENLLKLYEAMRLTRLLDERTVKLSRMGKLSTYPEATGQEAFSVGVAFAMKPEDIFVYYYRDQGSQLFRGIKPSEILSYWGGNERGSHFQHNRQDFPNCVPIATQYNHAAGVAFAVKYKGQSNAVVTTGGDGSTSKGDFYEAMNVAATWTLPLVFAINNNQWAISVPLKNQTSTATLAEKAVAANIPCLQVDGNDVIAVVHAVQLALEYAYAGKGPTLIEAVCYRLCNHTTADDATRYQPPIELEAARKLDPILRLETYLKNQQQLDEQKMAEITERCQNTIQTGIDEYLNAPKPKPTDMFDWLYAKLPNAYQTQRAALAGENDA